MKTTQPLLFLLALAALPWALDSSSSAGTPPIRSWERSLDLTPSAIRAMSQVAKLSGRMDWERWSAA